MSSIINSNINSLAAQMNLTRSQASLSTSINRLSSGLRINSSADDAAGYAIAQGFTSQINGTNQAIRNANDGVSLAQVAGGALNQITADLQRIRQLAVQSANATNSASDRASLQQEVAQLVGDIGSIGNTTKFNGLNILDGTYTGQTFQVGANAGNTIGVSIADARSQSMGVTTQESAFGYITSAATLTNGLLVNGTVIATATATSIADVIAAVNNASTATGVTASRALTNVSTVVYTPPATAQSITINGVSIGIPALATSAQLTSSINAASAQTGVSASFVGGTLTLTASNGGDAILSQSAAGILTAINGGATVGLGTLASPATTISAGVTFSSKLGAQPVIAENGAGTLAAALNVLSGTSAVTGTYQVSTLDVSTIASSTKAMQTVDFALAQVASTAAQLGAIQNRFTATVANLQTAATNLSASRSSIQDADFAAETANLSRTQVLQQAGTAILAQANQIPNTVLKLLQ